MTEPSLAYTLINLTKKLKTQMKNDFSEHPNIPYELLGHLGREGKTLKQLSVMMGCSKQEVSRQVKRAEYNNWVTLSVAADDARSKLVNFSEHGREQLAKGTAYYHSLEQHWSNTLGNEKVSRLKQLLNELEDMLEGANQ